MAMTIEERCACGATITVTGSEYRNDKHPNNPRGAEEVVERWRKDHRHEFPPAEPVLENAGDMPMFVESSSSHERAFDEGDIGARVRLGFQREA